MYRAEVYYWVVSVDTVEKLAEIMAFIVGTIHVCN